MMGWLSSTIMLVLMVASVGVILALPKSLSSPVLYIIPFMFFFAFLYTFDIK